MKKTDLTPSPREPKHKGQTPTPKQTSRTLKMTRERIRKIIEEQTTKILETSPQDYTHVIKIGPHF